MVSASVVRFRQSNNPPNLARARRVAHALVVCGLALGCCALGSEKGAALDSSRSAHGTTDSTSSGLPWDGQLQHGVRLHTSAVLRPLAQYRSRGNFYGTSELVSLLERTAQAIATRWPHSQLTVGELSASAGGKLSGHHSHRSGRDADVAFFMRDENGRSSRFWRFVAFGRDGIALHMAHTLHFDDARNWATVSTMLRDPQARLQYVFVADRIRARLLMEGRRQGESAAFLRAAAAVMVEPREGSKHTNHFHVRIYCPRDDRPNCQDTAPYWPWYDGNPPGGEYAQLPTIRWHVPSDSTAELQGPQARR